LHGEGRLVARLAAIAFDRVEERSLLAADVRAGALAHLDVETNALAHDIRAEQAGLPCLTDRVRDAFMRKRVFAADVEVPDVATRREACDRHGLHERERILFHE